MKNLNRIINNVENHFNQTKWDIDFKSNGLCTLLVNYNNMSITIYFYIQSLISLYSIETLGDYYFIKTPQDRKDLWFDIIKPELQILFENDDDLLNNIYKGDLK